MLRQIRYALIVGAFVVLTSLIYVRFPFGSVPRPGVAAKQESSQTSKSTIQIASTTVEVYLADTSETRARGLSGRDGLAEEEGMFFVFDEDGRHGFWMKDMRFAIDIVWISRDGIIVDIEENVDPTTYPAVFMPRSEARYVVELSAGWVGRHDVHVGDIVRL